MRDAARHPWRCLWRGSLQITRTTRLRRTILHFAHIFLTDAMTFMIRLHSLAGALRAPRCFPARLRHRSISPPLKCALRSRLSYWCDMMYAWTCDMKSMVTTTMMSSDVPPK